MFSTPKDDYTPLLCDFKAKIEHEFDWEAVEALLSYLPREFTKGMPYDEAMFDVEGRRWTQDLDVVKKLLLLGAAIGQVQGDDIGRGWANKCRAPLGYGYVTVEFAGGKFKEVDLPAV